MIRTAFLFLGLLLLPLSAHAENDALTSFTDAPGLYLMQGLTESADESMLFDKPEGRIVSAIAYGPVTRPDVLAFYQSLLPQLGWAKNRFGQYRRDGEALSLTVTNAENHLTRLEITIEPVQQTP
ncbi:MAG: hypothetical protein ABF335_03955 [Alphaproteobacteria bacterium]